ncbi:hypothetical protein T8K17_00420 [Thalassobaculum sp. OXR-137]|uniref:hypothetical protein n=1 Tax=Thalassobaculum sp. OXR-137 TaxID=3100173 RepID=UPI002AC93AEF|nr:hypothetical protein [Thalassobaculum sp. OXR-137]WPZ34611.1 hypothetical protein T8K17_00420 [Thalassobaculum sp. OXR-137]
MLTGYGWTATASAGPWAAPVWLEPNDGDEQAGLPRQPVSPGARQRRLARTHLGDLEGLHAFLLRLRERADADLAPRYPDFAGKPYPLGRCLEIRDAVFDALVQRIQRPDCPVTRSLNAFVAGGGFGGKIWGVLRESYFQNAIQLGPLYVDVANDTVTPSKPKVEILPLADSGMVPVASLEHFAGIARRYWQVDVYRNTVFPALAGYFPMICVSAQGVAWIEPGSGQVATLIRRQRMLPSLRFLHSADPPPAERVRALLRIKAASTNPLIVADGDPVTRVAADRAARRYADPAFLAACRAAREEVTPGADDRRP